MLVYVCFWIPFSFAEWCCVGRGNSPWTANLALCARMAHQSDSLATLHHSGTPNASLGANETGWHSFGYFSFAIERKVTRPRCDNRNAQQKEQSKYQTPIQYNTKADKPNQLS